METTGGTIGRTVIAAACFLLIAASAHGGSSHAEPEPDGGGWFSAAPAERAATARGDDTVPAALVARLIDWIGRHTGYDVSETRTDPPDMVFAWSGSQVPYEHGSLMVGRSLRAAYDEPARRIHLVRPWHVADVHDRSTLLHELIHDVQYRNRRWPCAGKAEWEAYKLQEAWLAERGIASGFNWQQIFFLSRCRRDMHP